MSDALRNPYIAREILKRPPFRPRSGHLLPVKADTFQWEVGNLPDVNRSQCPISDVMQPDNVAILLPRGFDEQYGQAVQGAGISQKVGHALLYLDVPIAQFAFGKVYAGGIHMTDMAVMTEDTYRDMAKAALFKLADPTEGAKLLDLKNPVLYRQALSNMDGTAAKIADNLLGHAGLSEEEVKSLRSIAIAKGSENYEFLTHLNAHFRRGANEQGNGSER